MNIEEDGDDDDGGGDEDEELGGGGEAQGSLKAWTGTLGLGRARTQTSWQLCHSLNLPLDVGEDWRTLSNFL